MRGRYLGQVGRHKPCEPEFGYVHMSPFGIVFVLPRRWPFCHDGGRDAFGRHGATQD